MCCLMLCSPEIIAQAYPVFGGEKKVAINGLNFDAMEPFISDDGNTLFFNSLNSGGNTNLYYAQRVNDTVFNFGGLVGGTYDASADHLDAVASMDSAGRFFWVSLRGYPGNMANLHTGKFSNGSVSDIKRVYGDFNIYTINYPLGWLIMDAGITYTGNLLLFCNALFDFSNTSCVGVPCQARIGLAGKVNDTTFNRLPDSDALLANVNDTAFLTYAPQLSRDGRELYFTRLLKNTYNTEVCVAVRNSPADVFSVPLVIHAKNGFVPEAATITDNQQKLYYHQKNASQRYELFLRYRTGTSAITESRRQENVKVYPIPAKNTLHIQPVLSKEDYVVKIYDARGMEIFNGANKSEIDVSQLVPGLYVLWFSQTNGQSAIRFIKE